MDGLPALQGRPLAGNFPDTKYTARKFFALRNRLACPTDGTTEDRNVGSSAAATRGRRAGAGALPAGIAAFACRAGGRSTSATVSRSIAQLRSDRARYGGLRRVATHSTGRFRSRRRWPTQCLDELSGSRAQRPTLGPVLLHEESHGPSTQERPVRDESNMPPHSKPNASAATIPQKIARPAGPPASDPAPCGRSLRPVGRSRRPSPRTESRSVRIKRSIRHPTVQAPRSRETRRRAPAIPPTTARRTAHPHQENGPRMARPRDRRARTRFAGRLHEDNRVLSRH